MSAVDTNYYKQKKESMFYLSLGFLIVVILVTGWLYAYFQSVVSQRDDISTAINQIDTSISERLSNPNIQAYNVYEKNRGLLEKMSYESKITAFVNHLKKNFIKYSVSGEWFSYNNGLVSVAMSAETNDNGYAYEKVLKFIRWYETDEKAIFELEDISTFTWYDQIKFDGSYQLK